MTDLLQQIEHAADLQDAATAEGTGASLGNVMSRAFDAAARNLPLRKIAEFIYELQGDCIEESHNLHQANQELAALRRRAEDRNDLANRLRRIDLPEGDGWQGKGQTIERIRDLCNRTDSSLSDGALDAIAVLIDRAEEEIESLRKRVDRLSAAAKVAIDATSVAATYEAVLRLEEAIAEQEAE